MTSDSELEETVRQLLESETFAPDELPEVLAKRGHSEAAVAETVTRVRHQLAQERESPAHRRAVAAAKRANHLLRIGVLTLVVGLAFTLLMGWG